MAFKQYTQCVDIQLFDPENPLIRAALIGLYITLPPGAFAALLAIAKVGSPWCLRFLVEVYVIAGVVGYCDWFTVIGSYTGGSSVFLRPLSTRLIVRATILSLEH